MIFVVPVHAVYDKRDVLGILLVEYRSISMRVVIVVSFVELNFVVLFMLLLIFFLQLHHMFSLDDSPIHLKSSIIWWISYKLS